MLTDGQYLHIDLVLGIGPAFNLYPLNYGVSLVAQAVKDSAYNAGDLGLIPGSGRSLGEGNGNPFQYSCWRISRTEESGGYSPWGCKESDMTEQQTLSLFTLA